MTTIYLKYGTYSGTTLTWSSSLTVTALKAIINGETNRIQGVDLRDIHFNHLVSKRSKSLFLTVSADFFATPANVTFFEAFFKAQVWKYSLDNWTSETEVELKESGELPWEYINENKNLKSLTLTLTQKAPD